MATHSPALSPTSLGTLARAIVLAGVVSGCGGGKKGEASVQACETWLATMECGETDHRGEFDCSIYAEERCDVTPYFTCITAKTECDEETSTFDFSGWDDCAVVAGCDE